MSQMTKRALAMSLKHLMSQKPLSKITIADLTADCGISRMTFYYHFQDIYDLIGWICRDEGTRAIQGRKDCQNWQEGVTSLCRTMVENRAFVEGVYHLVQREQIEDYLLRVTYHLLLPVVEEQSRDVDIAPEDQQYIADFYKHAFAGIMLDWVKSGFSQTPESVVGRLSRLVHGQIAAAVRNMARSGSPSDRDI